MRDFDLEYICATMGDLSGVPVRIFERNEQVFYHALVALPRDPMLLYRDSIWAVGAHLGYYVTPQFHYYGIVNACDTKVVVGPTFPVPSADQTLRELAFRADVPPDETETFVQGVKSIIPLADSTSEQSRHLCSVLCTQVMLEIARLRGLNQTMEASANHYITEALDILNENYAEPLTASDVAEQLHIHPSYLHRLFREYTSRTMKDHLQRIRIQHAQELLSESHKSIQEIAAEVGFSSAQQLQQMFRRVVGVRPNDYRKQQQE